jgi:hypothetical protein
MNLRGMALFVALVLFVIAAFDTTDRFGLLCIGLACFAGAFVVADLPGWTRKRP